MPGDPAADLATAPDGKPEETQEVDTETKRKRQDPVMALLSRTMNSLEGLSDVDQRRFLKALAVLTGESAV